MAINTYKTYLMHKVSSSWEKLIDIKDFPDLGSAPENLETTSLSDSMKTYIPGIQDAGGALTFTCNYDKDDYSDLLDMEGTEENFAVWFGGTADSQGEIQPDGSEGKWSFKGYLSVFPTGKGVNEVHEMTVSIMPSSIIKPE